MSDKWKKDNSEKSVRSNRYQRSMDEDTSIFSCQINIATQIECQPTCQGFNGKPCKNNVLQGFKSNLTSESHPLVEIAMMGAKGKGIRAKKFIPENTFIAEYIGQKLRPNDGKIKYGRYIMKIGDDFYDAESMSSYAQLINNGCDPNCKVEWWEVDGKMRAKVIAMRNIAEGKELTIEYKWNRREIPCYCEFSHCKGYI